MEFVGRMLALSRDDATQKAVARLLNGYIGMHPRTWLWLKEKRWNAQRSRLNRAEGNFRMERPSLVTTVTIGHWKQRMKTIDLLKFRIDGVTRV